MTRGITRVTHKDNNKGDEHITEVEVYTKDLWDNNWHDPRIEAVEEVIENIEKNIEEYVTLTSLGNNEFEEGAKVIVKKFITTKPDDDKKNNLGSLPEILPSFFKE